jgi:hypothetical protein
VTVKDGPEGGHLVKPSELNQRMLQETRKMNCTSSPHFPCSSQQKWEKENVVMTKSRGTVSGDLVGCGDL